MVAVSWYLARLIKSKGYFVRDSQTASESSALFVTSESSARGFSASFLAENNLN
jgi:hypothetical protein